MANVIQRIQNYLALPVLWITLLQEIQGFCKVPSEDDCDIDYSEIMDYNVPGSGFEK